jgi:hypothetical protein
MFARRTRPGLERPARTQPSGIPRPRSSSSLAIRLAEFTGETEGNEWNESLPDRCATIGSGGRPLSHVRQRREVHYQHASCNAYRTEGTRDRYFSGQRLICGGGSQLAFGRSGERTWAALAALLCFVLCFRSRLRGHRHRRWRPGEKQCRWRSTNPSRIPAFAVSPNGVAGDTRRYSWPESRTLSVLCGPRLPSALNRSLGFSTPQRRCNRQPHLQ